MRLVSTETRARNEAYAKLVIARQYRAQLQTAVTPQSDAAAVDRYIAALDAENEARAVYSSALNAETVARERAARNAGLIH